MEHWNTGTPLGKAEDFDESSGFDASQLNFNKHVCRGYQSLTAIDQTRACGSSSIKATLEALFFIFQKHLTLLYKGYLLPVCCTFGSEPTPRLWPLKLRFTTLQLLKDFSPNLQPKIHKMLAGVAILWCHTRKQTPSKLLQILKNRDRLDNL